MNKNDVKRILMSMRNSQNEAQVNGLLGKIDMLDESKLQEMITEIGDNEESIKNYLSQKLNEGQINRHEKHEPLNEMFA